MVEQNKFELADKVLTFILLIFTIVLIIYAYKYDLTLAPKSMLIAYDYESISKKTEDELNEKEKNIKLKHEELTKIYGDLIIEYSHFISENIKVKNSSFSRFIIIRGLDTITNVFLHILNATKNIELTYFHCQKSFYFYVEFVGQISDEEKSFLQLTSRDATTYVYKKTVFDINSEFKK